MFRVASLVLLLLRDLIPVHSKSKTYLIQEYRLTLTFASIEFEMVNRLTI